MICGGCGVGAVVWAVVAVVCRGSIFGWNVAVVIVFR